MPGTWKPEKIRRLSGNRPPGILELTMIEINDLIGKPFASDPENSYGPDSYSCYGLLWEVYRRYGINIGKTNISVTACKEASEQEIMEHAAKNWVQIESPEVPCGILIKSTNPDFASHIGAYIGNGKMIHVTMNRNVAVDRIRDWQNKIIGYFRYVDY